MIQSRVGNWGVTAPGARRRMTGRHSAAMLEARSVALVGASPRPGSLGERMITEVTGAARRRPRGVPGQPAAHRDRRAPCHAVAGRPARGPVDLVLLAVPDTALEEQLTLAARPR